MSTSSPQKTGVGFQRGFTLVELVMVMIIIGILAAVVAPRFFDIGIFQSRGFTDQVQASLRFAQKIAIAQRRFVCVTITGNSLSLTTGSTADCGTSLPSLSDGENYVINAPPGVTIDDASFYFTAMGKPFGTLDNPFVDLKTITIRGDMTRDIIVEAETGYVHQ